MDDPVPLPQATLSDPLIGQKRVSSWDPRFDGLFHYFSSLPVPVQVIKAPEYYYTFVNPAACNLMGRSAEAFLGKHISAIIPETQLQDLSTILNTVCQTGQSQVVAEMPITFDREGQSYSGYFNITYQPLQTKENEVLGVIINTIDVTEQVNSRLALKESQIRLETIEKMKAENEALQLVNRDLEQFAFVASHDLLEPLRKIDVFSVRLHQTNQSNIDQKGLEYLAKISSSARRMSDLVKGVLEYSRTTRDQNQFTTVDLNEVISEILLDVELVVEERKAIIDCSGLPRIEAIRLQMHRLFNNLISNSLKFTSLQPPRIEIKCASVSEQEMTRFKLDPTRKYVQVMVTDNGIGFQPEDFDKIFNMFYRLNTNPYPGFGIGLAVCKKIVDAHQGIIYADAQVDTGASFHIILPVRQDFSAKN